MSLQGAKCTAGLLVLLLVVARLAQAVTFTQVTIPCPPNLCAWHEFEDTPQWSPDGKNIAITSAAVDLNYFLSGTNVYAMAAPGETNAATPDFSLGQHLLGAPPHTPTTSSPSWAPDGQRLACLAFDGSVVVLFANDTTLVHVPATNYPLGKFDWSPDADVIAVSFAGSLATVEIPSGNRTWIPTGLSGVRDPDWSPDGQWIAFSSTDGGNSNVWIIPSTGGTARQITTDGAADSQPAWSPDGKRLAFVSDRSGNLDIWIINIDSGQVVQVTTDPATDDSPDWSPDGSRIVFVSERGGGGFSHIWMASELHTLSVESKDWSKVKRLFR
jgi:Tol biopolymer transport system component